jgi:adenylate cyclase
VNLASRIEGLTRHFGVPILAGEATRAAAAPARAWVEVDRVRVKGKAQAVTLFTPVPGEPPPSTALCEELGHWQLALDAHRLQHWDEAQSRLAGLCQDHPESPFAGLYRQLADRTARYRHSPPPPDWDGTFTFDAK